MILTYPLSFSISKGSLKGDRMPADGKGKKSKEWKEKSLTYTEGVTNDAEVNQTEGGVSFLPWKSGIAAVTFKP